MKIKSEILKMGEANLEVFSSTLQQLAVKDKNIVVVTSDSRGSGKLNPFAEKYPEQIVEVGIAEQNLVGIAAGLSSAGKKTFAVSPACFLTARSLEQIKNDVGYSDNNVNLIGISGGVSYGALGSTHHSLHDFAVLRAINNITIIAPADNYETEMAIRQASQMDSPSYIRFGKKPLPFLSDKKDFELGKGRVVKQGKDIAIIGTGETVCRALEAALLIEEKSDIKVGVISMHTIKPLDYELLSKIAKDYSAVLTVEEHSVFGGLGEACSSYLMETGSAIKFKIMGIPDEYTVTGSQSEILDHYGISNKGIADTVLKWMK